MAQKNLSKLQENFTCLAIVCVDLIKLPLLDILINHIKPINLYSEINCSALISGNKLGPDQKKICYITPPGIPDYNKFDVSLLCTLIRNLCPSLKPTGKWGVEPAASHTQLGDDIERLRRCRNKFAHANSAEISDGEFNKHWTDLQNVVNRIQSNKKAGCTTDYRQNFKSIEKRLLNCDDLEKYKLLLEATMHVSKQREDMDGPDIWIEGTEEAACGSTAHFQATVKEKKVSFLSVSWQKLSKNESTQIDKSNKKFCGKTNKELSIESVCKEDEGEYQAVLSIEEDRIRKTIQSNVIFLRVVGGIPSVTTSHETCLQTHSVKLIGNVFVIDDLPVIDEMYWTKNGNKIDTQGNEEKYSKVSVDVPSLTIYNVNQYDAGHYTLTATNAAGKTVSEAIVLGAPDIVLGESKEESDGSQIFTFTIKSIPAAYNIQWQVSENNSDMFTTLDENAEEYRGTSHTLPHPVLVVRQKEILKNNIYQIEVQNFIGGRRKKIPSILNMFYKDRGAGVMFAKLFNEMAELFPERKLNRLQDLILDSCKDRDKELSPLIKNATSAREYFRILKDKELFTPSDVIFLQFLLRESNCGVLNEKCIAYAKNQKALCFYEEPPRNGYKKVQFHVQGNISNYTADQIGIIKETVAAIVRCDNEEIHLSGFHNSNSFFVVLSMKERYVNGLFNMKQQDKEKLVNLNINYFIVDSDHVDLKSPKEVENTEMYEKLNQKIIAPDWLRPSNTSELHKCNPQPYTYPEEMAFPGDALLVVAIDIGTTFSGYAFGMKSDPSNIYVNHWRTSVGDMQSFKTPTTVLLDKYKQVVAFGFEAEALYAELSENEEGEDYFYFQRFKLMLYGHAKTKNLNRDTMISDIRGRELPALEVFACAIAYLKNHLLDELNSHQMGVFMRDIYWVLTVPAIWDDKGKFFMRSAAIQAGIPSDQLIIALEPESASIYCKNLPAEKLEGTKTISFFQPGSKYLVLDAGGGTVDITVHEVKQNGQLQELERASGGNWGGASVDSAFMSVLEEITTGEMFAGYCRNYPEGYLRLLRDFEMKKRICTKDLNSHIRLAIPISFSEECSTFLKTDLTTLIKKSKFKNDIKSIRDSLLIKIRLFETFFQPACDGIIKHVKELFQSPKVKGVNKILMVGGLSESNILQEAIRNAFPDCQVVVPEEATTAVLRGAVFFGFHPNTITSRIARFTYGVDMNAVFDPAIHKESKKEVIEGVEYCTGIFDKHVEQGDELFDDVEHGIRYYIPITPKQNVVSFSIYTSTERNPLYIDHCAGIGKVVVNVPVGSKDSIVDVRMVFVRTELIIKAFVPTTGEETVVHVNMLD